MNINRYQRQLILSEIGNEGQKRLINSRVLCVGTGGLGAPCLQYLVSSGVGTVGFIDFDRVEESNLHRQILFQNKDIGRSKVESAYDALKALNPNIKLTAHSEKLTAKNIKNIFTHYDLIIDGSDSFATKFLIADSAFAFNLPYIYGAITGFEGSIALFNPTQGSSCYRCLFQSLPQSRIQNCAEAGVLPTAVGQLGIMQAHLALNYLISKGAQDHPLKPETGILYFFNYLGSFEFKKIKIPKNKNCPCCSKNPDAIHIQDYTDTACNLNNSITVAEIKPEVLIQKLKNNTSDFSLVDVREWDEWQTGRLKDAHCIPLSRLQKDQNIQISLNKKVIVYCQSGKRSLVAIELLKSNFKNHEFINLSGGISGIPLTFFVH